MKKIEINLVRSFRAVKEDIIEIKDQILELSQRQEDLVKLILENKKGDAKLAQKVNDLSNKQTIAKKVVRVVKSESPKEFVASKTAKKFHIPACPFAKNIKPNRKVTYKTKNEALNKGLKPCECVKKI